jgi:hypothetical protein
MSRNQEETDFRQEPGRDSLDDLLIEGIRDSIVIMEITDRLYIELGTIKARTEADLQAQRVVCRLRLRQELAG